MGAYLSEPVKDKEVDIGETDLVKYACAAMQGWRTEMEDAHVAATKLPKNTDVFGVFDGHGGKEVAKFVALHFANEFQNTEEFKKNDLKSALKRTFLVMDELMLMEENWQQLSELAKNENDDQGLEVSNMEEIPGFLRDAILASQKSGEQASIDGKLDEKMQDIKSFPIEVTQFEDDDDDDDDEDDEEEESDKLETEEEEDVLEELEKDGFGEVQTNKRRKAEGKDTSPKASNGIQEDAANGGAGSLPRVAPTEDIVADGDCGDVESPRTPENQIVGMVDNMRRKSFGSMAGCTAVVAAIRGNHLYVANAGDSRCVLCRKGNAVPLSFDHKPTDADERDRIEKAGGWVCDGRVNGNLNLSRALGDMEYKRSKDLLPEAQIVTASPDIMDIKLEKGDNFMLLACDGIWDVLDRQECTLELEDVVRHLTAENSVSSLQSVDFVTQRLQQAMEPDAICQEMCDHCLADDTYGKGEGCDNMTVMVVVLKKFSNLQVSK